MEYYTRIKRYDLVSEKNSDESEERSELSNTILSDVDKMYIKNIHNKIKDYR